MKKSILLTLLTLAAALPAFSLEKHQSFISYDDGGTVIRTGDGTEVEGRRNLPIYPDDEIVTARRGRAEVRLSDGNILGIDRATALRFRSILDSYEGDAQETVAELKYGKIMVYRTDLGQDHVRLDTQNVSYVADLLALYSVETDSHGADRIKVFEGAVEVRTPSRTTRLRQGESAEIDGRGIYDLVSSRGADDFERWFLDRAEQFDGRSSQYVDRKLSYWTDDLDDYGTWVNVSGIGYAWRPTVSVGWRPYYNGYWYNRYGCLTWVSYDPWGWGPYHYGRWAYDPFYGWVWAPGYGYSPAWVYWWYGPTYVGWAPSGWWDCHPNYYNWAYRPYRNRGADFGFGFHGRVNVNEMDLRPWTFVDSVGLISTRVDRAALTTDAVKNRLGRSGTFATIASGPNRMTNEELRDPAEAIRRRSIEGRDGRLTGRETGAGAAGLSGGGDLTPYFRRDSNVAGVIRDRVVRSSGGNVVGGATSVSRSSGSGVAPVGGGGLAPITGGSVAPISGGSQQQPAAGSIDRRGGDSGGRIDRGSGGSSSSGGVSDSRAGGGSSSWRGGTVSRSRVETVDRPAQSPDATGTTEVPRSGRESSTTPSRPSTTVETPAARDNWRNRTTSGTDSTRARSVDSSNRGGSDVPRRVIDRIGGARIVPRQSTPSSTTGQSRSGGSSSTRSRAASSSGSGSSARSSGGSSGGSSNSGGSSSSGHSGGSSSGSSGGSQSSGGSRGSGGHINRGN